MALWKREFPLLRRLRESWILVYGRRKTGKTYAVRTVVEWDMYITVTRDLGAVVE